MYVKKSEETKEKRCQLFEYERSTKNKQSVYYLVWLEQFHMYVRCTYVERVLTKSAARVTFDDEIG